MNNKKNGDLYEKKAADYLKSEGYRILDTNYRCKFGEIDIVAAEGKTLVFVEVKHRQTLRAGDPLEAVTFRKIKRISMTASYYIMMHNVPSDTPIRFDVIGYLKDEMTHVKNAFEYVGP